MLQSPGASRVILLNAYPVGEKSRSTSGACLLRRIVLLGVLIGFAGTALWAQNGAFETGLYPILEKAGCRACHNVDGVASATRLHFPESSAPAPAIEAFGNSLVVLIDREHPEAS